MEINGYPNYLIYPDGRVWSKGGKRHKPTFKKHQKNEKTGYSIIALSNSEKKIRCKTYTIHRLVAQHYIPNPGNKSQVNHIDGNKKNNDISNLEWMTNIENSNSFASNRKNKSGHRNICYDDTLCKKRHWRFTKTYYGKTISRYFINKVDALCYKFIVILKVRSKINNINI
jgi:hypothetical protein